MRMLSNSARAQLPGTVPLFQCWSSVSILLLCGTIVAQIPLAPPSTGSGWQLLRLDESPPPRANHSMAIDQATEKVVLFGGSGSNGLLDDTWLWDGRKWSPQTSEKHPSKRTNHSLASMESGVLLFGGSDHDVGNMRLLGDTWEYRGGAWARRAPSRSPSPRNGHRMALDLKTSRVLLFGGKADSGKPLSDTWLWDGTNWSEVSAEDGPSARAHMIIVTDTARKRMVLYGGEGASTDTWEWDGVGWNRMRPRTSPKARIGCAAYDSMRRLVVAHFHRMDASGEYCEMWGWDGVDWRLLGDFKDSSAPVLPCAEMASNLGTGGVFLFGGFRNGVGWFGKPDTIPSAETWLFSSK